MKKIIFVGGTSRSGSTLLDVILANDPKAMSLGEIKFLFRPFRVHDFEERERLKAHPIWSQILEGGGRNLYPNLSRMFPDVEVFVDSSKDPYWFRSQDKANRNRFHIQHVLIYKTPEELACSYIKRNMPDRWVNAYIDYHRLYFSLINDFASISYRDLACDDAGLSKLCERLDLIYFNGKRNYWERQHPTFFGSNSIRGINAHKALGPMSQIQRRELKYDFKIDPDSAVLIREAMHENPVINQVYSELKRHDLELGKNTKPDSSLLLNKMYVLLLGLKLELQRRWNNRSPLDYFNMNS